MCVFMDYDVLFTFIKKRILTLDLWFLCYGEDPLKVPALYFIEAQLQVPQAIILEIPVVLRTSILKDFR